MSVTRVCATCDFTASYTSEAMAQYHHRRHSCTKHLRARQRAQARAARTKAGQKRNCRHPRAKHQHGTRVAYVRDQCRCAKCTAVNTAASNATHRERTFGRWEPYLDAGPCRAHIEELRGAGIGIDQIAKLAGLSNSHLRGLIYPSRTGKPPYQRVRLETAECILAVPVEDSSRAANSHVDATGTRRRLQALIAIGWAQSWLARELHRSPPNFRRSMTADTVAARTARLVNEMYERLWDAPPPQNTSSQRNASDAARAHAALQGWLPPLAWDDIDNDPNPDPTQPHTTRDEEEALDEIAIERAISGDTRVHLTYAEQIEVVRRMSERGRSIRTIADLLSTSKRTVSRHRRQGSAA